ncbi:hypothetical protein niasHS_012597 [Heterodera schachtii]|uniref:G-protein coupled receptors family 1 profile domain-containing protein n=1 Tax=Heterodera schachtii TaxID=97005 RepID=A0ABD2ICR1_HETSC
MADAYAHAASSSSASSPSASLFHNEDSNRGAGAMLLVHDAGDGNGGIGATAQLFAAALAAAAASSSSSASVPYLYDDAAATAASSSSTVPPPAHPPPPILDTWRVPPSLFTVFVSFYAAVFFCGLVGNVFVVAAIALNKTFRTATDWLISSLAIADLLILMFCLPSTLLNNLLTEWQLGSWGCKLSVWVNSTTSCASIFTLVGVTGDRYLAICHPLRQLKMKNSLLHLYILGIWLLSALMASPNLWVYRQILYDLISGQQLSPDDVQQHHHNSYNNNNGIISSNNGQLVARLCVDTSNNIWLFIVINLLIAFLVPIVVICVLYALIFRAVSRHTRKKLAVDNGARIRDERVKLRIAQMMFTVIVVFVLCWTPLYALYCYFFMAEDRDSMFFQFASSVLRPIFQWLSLLSSSLNPLIYIAFSQKYRRAFHSLLLFPCRRRYKEFKQATRSTFRRSSCFSEKPSTVQLFSCQLGNNNYALRGEENVCANYNFSNNNNNIHRKSADSALGQQTATIRQQQQQQQLRKVSFTTAATVGGMATAQQRQQSPATWRKMSEQSPLPLHLQQQRLNGGWRPLPPSFNSSSCCSPSSRLTTATTTTTSCGDGTTTNGSGPPMVANLLRRVALENSQRQWWQRQKMASMQSNDGEQDKNGSSRDSKKRWRGGDAERKRREWREAMTASPERRMARDDNASGDAAEGSNGGTCTGRRATAAAASSRTRSADPLLRAISDTCGTATGD